MQEARLALLQAMPIFGGVTKDTLALLLDVSPIVFVPKGKFFFRENDPASSLFVLEEGKISILKSWNGRDYLLKNFGKGDCFGEMALLDLRPRSASVLAIEDCTAIELSTDTLHKLYEKDLEQLAMIYMNMGREVSRRLREADNRLFQARVEAELVEEDYVFRSI